MLSCARWGAGGHVGAHWHTYRQMKRRLVRELLASAVSQGLPVVKSLGALVLSSCQKFLLREELCVWPNNFALKTPNFKTTCVCLCVHETLFFVREHHVSRWPLAALRCPKIPSCLWSLRFCILLQISWEFLAPFVVFALRKPELESSKLV